MTLYNEVPEWLMTLINVGGIEYALYEKRNAPMQRRTMGHLTFSILNLFIFDIISKQNPLHLSKPLISWLSRDDNEARPCCRVDLVCTNVGQVCPLTDIPAWYIFK